MSRFLLIPDSFKGTMSSEKICSIMAKAIRNNEPEAQIYSIPVADGGEGSVDAFLQSQAGEKIYTRVSGPYFKEMTSFYGLIDSGRTAVIEMASCAGLPLVEGNLNPGQTTTFGVGELIIKAMEQGCEKIILGLGGSCTNDGGTGAAAALGVRFFNKDGGSFVPVGSSLKDIERIDISNLHPGLSKIELISMCDIDNPLYGEQGAAYVFSPQKGADAPMVKELDEGLRHLSSKIQETIGHDYSQMPGAGAAGGMGFGMVALLGSVLQMGIETVLDAVHFDEILKDTDYVFSGEGRFDSQSLRGKVVMGIAKRTQQANVPLIAIVGGIGDGIEKAYLKGISGIFSINRLPEDLSVSKSKSEENLYHTVDNLIKFMKVIKNN